MSHASGLVRFEDKEIWHYEYNGTADIVISHIYDTFEEMESNWRKGEWMNCTCGGEVPVEITTTYGRGFYFPGFACKKCKSLRVKEIKEGHTNYDVYEVADITSGVPDWAEEYYNNNN